LQNYDGNKFLSVHEAGYGVAARGMNSARPAQREIRHPPAAPA